MTSLRACLNLLVEPTRGELFFLGEQIGEWPPQRARKPINLAEYRSHVSMVFQQFELFPHLTAAENVSLGPRRVLHLPKATAHERALSLLDPVGLKPFANARTRTLSGGQQPRGA